MTTISTAMMLAVAIFAPEGTSALPPIANPPPSFRIYDVDRREREMRRLIAQLAGTPALSRRQAHAAFKRLHRIEAQERNGRDHAGGNLNTATIRKVDAELNVLARTLGLRESSR